MAAIRWSSLLAISDAGSVLGGSVLGGSFAPRSVGKIVLTVVSTRAAFALLFCYMYRYYVDLDLQGLTLTAGMAQALTLHATIVNLARPTIALSQDFGSFILI